MEGDFEAYYACIALRRWGVLPGEYMRMSREEKAFLAAFLDIEKEVTEEKRR